MYVCTVVQVLRQKTEVQNILQYLVISNFSIVQFLYLFNGKKWRKFSRIKLLITPPPLNGLLKTKYLWDPQGVLHRVLSKKFSSRFKFAWNRYYSSPRYTLFVHVRWDITNKNLNSTYLPHPLYDYLYLYTLLEVFYSNCHGLTVWYSLTLCNIRW